MNLEPIEKDKKVLALATLFVVALLIAFYGERIEVSKQTSEAYSVSEEQLISCRQDSDCAVVDYLTCCADKRAINKDYLEEYRLRPDLQTDEEAQRICSVVQCPLMEKPIGAACNVGRCQLIFNDTDNGTACIQVITPARNPDTGEVVDFPTPCDVPEGWETVSSQ